MKLKIRFLIVPTLALMLLLFAAIVRADTVHVIQPGDSLYRISLQYGVTIDAIVQANNIVNPNLIVAGHELIIPGVDGPATGQPLPAATATPSPTTPTTLPAHAIVVEDGVLHTVQKLSLIHI